MPLCNHFNRLTLLDVEGSFLELTADMLYVYACMRAKGCVRQIEEEHAEDFADVSRLLWLEASSRGRGWCDLWLYVDGGTAPHARAFPTTTHTSPMRLEAGVFSVQRSKAFRGRPPGNPLYGRDQA
jgi:hypothetical protein